MVAKTLEGLPAAEAWHVEVEEDGFDVVLGGQDKGFVAGDRFDDGIALTGEVFRDYGTNAGVVVADQNGAFTASRGRVRRVGC